MSLSQISLSDTSLILGNDSPLPMFAAYHLFHSPHSHWCKIAVNSDMNRESDAFAPSLQSVKAMITAVKEVTENEI